MKPNAVSALPLAVLLSLLFWAVFVCVITACGGSSLSTTDRTGSTIFTANNDFWMHLVEKSVNNGVNLANSEQS